MRKALFIFVLIICLTFAACGDTPVDQPDSPSVTYGNQDASAPVDSQPVDNPDNVTDTETAQTDCTTAVIFHRSFRLLRRISGSMKIFWNVL